LDNSALDGCFLTMLNEHRGAIQRVTRTYTTNLGDREDLVQEIVYQLWRAFPAYRRESKSVTWVYRIALNTAITGVRRRTRRPVHIPLAVDFDVPSPSTPVDSEARTELLFRLIQELGEVERALLMCYLDGLSYREIASVLGISESNVGARLSRTKAKLQDLLKGME